MKAADVRAALADVIRGKREVLPEHSVYLASSVATTVLALSGDKRLQYASKSVMAPALAARVIREYRDKRLDGIDTTLLLVGLAAATVGDVFMVDADNDDRLVRGASSFGVMQSAYTTVLRQAGAKPHVATALPQAATAAAGSGLLFWRLPAVAKPLSAYSFALGATATLASDPALAPGARQVAGIPVPERNDPRTWLAAGGLVFSVSDASIVVRRMFLKGETSKRLAEGLVIATYAAAHVMLIEGMLRLRRR
ncbi:lysoplasmalogenase family protein [Tomitella biformata]|uniref:lysoplasmalogenase family protein n=1 Tax=Tomitella biformata TaxID=630403 RepID=UPI0004B2BEA7|nr:lysoplasmalogenase family protein [Tomitella biformata]